MAADFVGSRNIGLLEKALELHRRGALAEAVSQYHQILRDDPSNADALYYLATASYQQGHLEECQRCLRMALAIVPTYARANRLLAITQQQLGQLLDALESVDRAIASDSDFADGFGTKGDILAALGRSHDALVSYDRAVALQPGSASDWLNRGTLLGDLGRHEEELASYDEAIAQKPEFYQAHFNRAGALQKLGRFSEALIAVGRALALEPHWAEALNNQGLLQNQIGLFENALSSLNAALAIKPDFADALNNRGNVLVKLGRLEEAIADFDKAILKNPSFAEAHFNYGNTLCKLHRIEEAIARYEKTLVAQPSHKYALGSLVFCKLQNCDWTGLEPLERELADKTIEEKVVIAPFSQLALWHGAKDHLKAALNFAQSEPCLACTPKPFVHSVNPSPRKLRIAYLSADFHTHATMVLAAGLFEQHDRDRFEVFGISYGPDDRSDLRRRAIKAFDQFHDVRHMSDGETSSLIHRLGIDIAVDLKGITEDARPGILKSHPAPIQVSYLGYPGTMGVEFIDYIIADRIVLPFDQQGFYREKIVHLPDSYQVNDKKRAIPSSIPTRLAVGLPEEGFVFCCFNNSWKIRSRIFDIWMRLLQEVPRSVLWLLQSTPAMNENLRTEARKRNVDPGRLLFAPRVSTSMNLARLSLADLFLDTLPYNAHTTASDALWMGVPVLTCMGEMFQSRVAASLLHAVDLPELVATNLLDYETMAKSLAFDPAILNSCHRKLLTFRATCRLFDTDRFCKNIETAYEIMWGIWQRGEQPRSFVAEFS